MLYEVLVTKDVLPECTSIHFFKVLSFLHGKSSLRETLLCVLELLNDEKNFGERSIFQQQIEVIETPDYIWKLI